MALPTKFRSPNQASQVALPKHPAPAGPSASTPHATAAATPHAASPAASSSSAAGSLATDWQTTNSLRRQQLQTQHGLHADEAHKLTSAADDSDDNADH